MAKELLHKSQFEKPIMIDGIPHADTNPKMLHEISNHLKSTPIKVQEILDRLVIERDTGIAGDLIESTIKNLNKKFEKSLDLPPTQAMILTGSTSNVDRSSHLKESREAQLKIDLALEQAVDEGKKFGKDRNKVIKEIEDIIYQEDSLLLPKDINTRAQVIGFILRAFKFPGDRIQINDLEGKPGSGKELGDWIGKTFKFDSEKGGGAAFQVGDFLSGIGEDYITIHSQYRSPDQVGSLKHSPHLLKVNDDEIIVVDKDQAARPDDPTKINQIIEISANIELEFNDKKLRSKNEADRYIFLSQLYDKDGLVIKTDPTLKFSDEILNDIGNKFEYFFTTAPTYLQGYTDNEYVKYSQELSRQFQLLRSKGVKILYEFAGNTAKNISFLRDVLKGNISSFSLNDGELETLIDAINRDVHIDINVKKGKDPLTIYNNALELAKYLEVDRVHVHGHNFDISVRKNATDEEMKNEVSALMHAKQRVTEWIRGKVSVKKTPEVDKTSRLLKREGYIDFLKFTEKLAENTFPEHNSETYFKRIKLKYNLQNNCFYKADNEYSVAIIPTKWIYDEALVTTSSGDIMAIVAAIHALFKGKRN